MLCNPVERTLMFIPHIGNGQLLCFDAESNRLAIGAKLKLTAGGVTQTEQIRSGGSYLSHSDFRVYFGLGSASKVESVEIRWPSGATDVMRNLASDQFYSVLEGKGLVKPEDINPGAAHP